MRFTEDLIKDAMHKGFKPVINRGVVALFKCTSCGKVKLVKFSPPTNRRKRVHACACGYRKGF